MELADGTEKKNPQDQGRKWLQSLSIFIFD